MEKAQNSSILLCRSCGHTTSAMSRAEMAKKIEALEKRWETLDKEAKEKADKPKEKEVW